MAEGICIEVDHRLEEHRRAERLFYARSRWRHPMRVASALLLAAAFLDGFHRGVRWWGWVGLGVGLLLMAHPFLLKDALLGLRFRLSPRLREPVGMRLDGAGVHFRLATLDSCVPWSDYAAVLEDDALLLLLYPQGYTLLPKRCFGSPERLEAARRLMARRLEGPAVLVGAGPAAE